MKKLKARRTIIIRELCALSRNGWAQAKACDWQPLEAELDQINQQLEKRT